MRNKIKQKNSEIEKRSFMKQKHVSSVLKYENDQYFLLQFPHRMFKIQPIDDNYEFRIIENLRRVNTLN